MTDDSSPERVTRKEAARLARRAAYQKAKAARATDPRFLAFKVAQKERRRAMSAQQKERRKEAKRALEQREAERREAERVEKARALLRLISR